MSIEQVIYQRLASSANLEAILGENIFPTVPTEDSQLPSLVYAITGAEPVSGTDGPTNLVSYQVQLDSFAVNLAEVLSVMNVAKSLFHGYRGGSIQYSTLTSEATQEEDFGHHGIQSFTVWSDEVVVHAEPEATARIEIVGGDIRICGTLTDCDGNPLSTGGGGGGGEDAFFTHNQSSPSSTWTITHNLGKYPSVTVVDSGGSVVLGSVTYNTANQVTVSFTTAFGGRAYLN